MRSSGTFAGSDTYRPGNAWFRCDRCGGRYRRSEMLVEWDNLRVDRKCLDPRPPQTSPPDVFPEGVPFFDARPPNDRPDRLEDDTSLQSVVGGIKVTPGVTYPDAQYQVPGSISPLPVTETVSFPTGPLQTESLEDIETEDGIIIEVSDYGTPYGPNVLADDVTFITGPVAAPSNT